MRIKSIFLIFSILFVWAYLCPAVARVYAESASCSSTAECDALITKYQKKLDSLGSQATTLGNEIDYMDNQIAITEVKIQNSINNINATQAKIEKLNGDISDLGLRIDKLQKSIDHQMVVLGARMRERYKEKDDSVLMIVFGSDTFNQLVHKAEYLKVMELNDSKLIADMGNSKKTFEEQKTLFEQVKSEQEKLKLQLVTEKASLDSYRASLQDQMKTKADLLAQTQNDETKYQKLLTDAQAQLNSFRGFTSTAGGGVISSNGFGKGKEGWYFSQRDSRWAYKTIGTSKENIFNVGCLVTSVAMVYKSHGKDVTPLDIARRDIFFANTAYMIIPDDFTTYWGTYSSLVARINAQLKEDNPVIVGLKVGPYGTHYIVLSGRDGSGYIMYDPWYGPDLKFSSHYSTGSVFDIVTHD
jgi:peptidoglycan hydrolase CwlO-like protein